MSIDVANLREQFPALKRKLNGLPAVYFDGPAGSQVPQSVIDAVSHYLAYTNANTHGQFATAHESDAVLQKAQQAVADFLGTPNPNLVVFGPNMTTLTFGLSRALAKTWKPGDEIMVSRLDHDANVTPWVLAARDAGATVRHIGIHTEDATLDMDDFESKLSEKTRLVAVGAAANATGTVNPVREICRKAHEVNSQVFVDAVHYAPHGLIDVEGWDCDYVACSAYKFFGPHVGILWGKREIMQSLPAYRVRPAGDELPDRWMTGTQNHEGIAGTLAAIDYLAGLASGSDRRGALKNSYAAIAEYERKLTTQLLEGLKRNKDVQIWGITDVDRLQERAPTISITHARHKPEAVAAHLAEHGIFVWHGNFYALPLTEALGLEPDGMVRIGLLHYNTSEEVNRLLETLSQL